MGDDRDRSSLQSEHPPGLGQIAERRDPEREREQQHGRGQGETRPGRCHSKHSGTLQPDSHTDLARRRARQELAQRDKVRIGTITEPPAPFHELGTKVPEVRHGATDMGQGINDAIVMITARALGIPTQDVAVHTADTRYDPPGGVTTASRQTFISGNAALQAAEAVREQLWKTVSEEFGVPVEDLAVRERAFVQLSSGRRLIDLQTLAASGPRFEARITYDPPTTADQPGYSPAHPTEKRPPLHFAYDYGVQAAMVAVQPESGAVRVLKIIAAHDVGRTISRRNVIGQIEGAIVQGLGYALSEAFVVENGLPKTLKFKDLGLLRFRDLPEIEPIIIEDPHVLGPFGAKGMGELTISPTAPAVVNAIHDAVGVWMTELPVTPEKLLAALHAAADPTL